eukprot:TRINITY_DN7342_c0_g1_i2.p2 TRINITY_DN7342_c0_g1~~TRINITY_DN7342_c0_g1_i2.p2  ORF type:complete len:237 (-),score=52.67 TRINITY_DN7342_c0_g1_i2:373-1083(-)
MHEYLEEKNNQQSNKQQQNNETYQKQIQKNNNNLQQQSVSQNQTNKLFELFEIKIKSAIQTIVKQYSQLNDLINRINSKEKLKKEKEIKQLIGQPKKSKQFSIQIGSYKFDIDQLMQDSESEISSEQEEDEPLEQFNYLLPEKQNDIFDKIKEICANDVVKVKECSSECSTYIIKQKKERQLKIVGSKFNLTIKQNQNTCFFNKYRKKVSRARRAKRGKQITRSWIIIFIEKIIQG